ncbi:hypothetical protein [Pacificoceanicola onchidii]|uniref:hypothetical protein n=1 Tax=Pacificoceanicola onchidii TaxID=2562685 RepID=UPI001455E1DA|nr:hypothetical protein [Pacificoceanicola onchidii]
MIVDRGLGMRGGAEDQALIVLQKLVPRGDIGVISLCEELKNNPKNSNVPRMTGLAMLSCGVVDHVHGPDWTTLTNSDRGHIKIMAFTQAGVPAMQSKAAFSALI